MTLSYRKLISILKYLNIRLKNPTEDENFSERLLIQKLAFISKSLGIKMDYEFSLYKKGPYCPQLTNDYYNNPYDIINLNTAINLSQEEGFILDTMKDIIFSYPLYSTHKVDLLQAVSTLLYFYKKHSKISKDDLIYWTKNEKPYLSDNVIRRALNLVIDLTNILNI